MSVIILQSVMFIHSNRMTETGLCIVFIIFAFVSVLFHYVKYIYNDFKDNIVSVCSCHTLKLFSYMHKIE